MNIILNRSEGMMLKNRNNNKIIIMAIYQAPVPQVAPGALQSYMYYNIDMTFTKYTFTSTMPANSNQLENENVKLHSHQNLRLYYATD